MTQISAPASFGAFTAAKLATAEKPVTASSADRDALAQAAKSFEAIFTRKMLGSMRQASLGEDLAGGSGVDQFREMSDANMADDLAKKGGLGIAQLILQQLDRKP